MPNFMLQTCALKSGWPPLNDAFHRLLLPVSGVTGLKVQGEDYWVSDQQGCLIPADVAHEYAGNGCNHTLILDVPVERPTASGFTGEVERLFERLRFFSVTELIQSLVATMAIYLENSPALKDEISALLLRAVYIDLHGEDERMAPQRPAQQNGTELTSLQGAGRHMRIKIARIDRYIDEQLACEIRVDDLASLCALSAGHFHVCFREIYGVTPQAYVQQRRLKHAKALVRTSDMSLGRIAQHVGFRDQASFTRAYRRIFHVAPSTHRFDAWSLQ